MAIWSEVNYLEAISGQRLDSEYFDPTDLSIIKDLLNDCEAITLGDLCLITSGLTPQYSDEGVPILRSGDLSQLNIVEADLLKTDLKDGKIFYLQKFDILISSIGQGSIGKVNIYLGEDNRIGTVSEVTILRNANVNPYYLALYLMSEVGQRLIVRQVTGATGQQHLLPSKVKNILVPFPKESHEWATEAYTKIINNLDLSKQLYSEAEQIIIDYLKIDNLDLIPMLFTLRNSNEIIRDARVDADHFTSKSFIVEKKIYEYSIENNKEYKLGNLVSIVRRGTQPEYTDSDDGCTVVNSKHVQPGFVILDGNRRATALKENQLFVNYGDILMNGTGLGTIGRCATYLHDMEAIPDNHVTIIRTNKIDPIYLSVFLNSIAGQLQVQKHQRGSSGQVELYPVDIEKFYVWNAPIDIQKQIKDKVIAAFLAIQEANKLLEDAKKQIINIIKREMID